MALTHEIIQQKLNDKFPGQLIDWQEPYGMLTFSANDNSINLKVLQFLFDEATLGFRFLTDLQEFPLEDQSRVDKDDEMFGR